MKVPQEKPDCTACEQRLLEAEDLHALRQEETVAGHLADCPSCADLYDSLLAVKVHLDQYVVQEPAQELIHAVLARTESLQPAVKAQDTTPSSASLFRVVLAGLAALPLVLLINTLTGWALFELASFVLPRILALYCIGLFVAWASLGVSLSYASLPFLSLLAGETPHRARRS